MAPKVKYSKEAIADAAFELARQKGFDHILARDVAAALGISTSPIFTAYSGMEELRTAVLQRARESFMSFGGGDDGKTPAFMRYCTRMIGFAKDEPKLFHLVFGSAGFDSPEQLQLAEECTKVLQEDYSLSEDDAAFLFSQFRIYTYGLCMLLSEGGMETDSAELNLMLSDEFKAQYLLIKSGNR